MVLSLTTLTIVPAINQVYEERMAVQQEKQALLLLENAVTNWAYETSFHFDEEIVEFQTKYSMSYQYDSVVQEFLVCVDWIGRNHRSYVRCATAKR